MRTISAIALIIGFIVGINSALNFILSHDYIQLGLLRLSASYLFKTLNKIGCPSKIR